MWAKNSGTCRLVVSVVYDEVICDDAFELKDFGDVKIGVSGQVLFVLMPLLLKECMEFVGDVFSVLDWHAVVFKPLKEGSCDLLLVPFPSGECCAEAVAVFVVLQVWRQGESVKSGGNVAGVMDGVWMLEQESGTLARWEFL